MMPTDEKRKAEKARWYEGLRERIDYDGLKEHPMSPAFAFISMCMEDVKREGVGDLLPLHKLAHDFYDKNFAKQYRTFEEYAQFLGFALMILRDNLLDENVVRPEIN